MKAVAQPHNETRPMVPLADTSIPVREPLNTLSSVPYSLSGLAVIAVHAGPIVSLFAVAMMTVGVGSALWHAARTTWSQRLDEWAMMTVLTSLFGLACTQALKVPVWATGPIILTSWWWFWGNVDRTDSFIVIPALGVPVQVLVYVHAGAPTGLLTTAIVVVTLAVRFVPELVERPWWPSWASPPWVPRDGAHGAWHPWWHLASDAWLITCAFALLTGPLI